MTPSKKKATVRKKPFTSQFRAIGLVECALSVSTVSVDRAYIILAIRPVMNPVAFLHIVNIIAFKVFTIGPSVFSLSMGFILEKLAGIDIAISEF